MGIRMRSIVVMGILGLLAHRGNRGDELQAQCQQRPRRSKGQEQYHSQLRNGDHEIHEDSTEATGD